MMAEVKTERRRRQAGTMSTDIRRIGIIGAGQMGSGIAQVCATSGYDVCLHDISEDRIHAGLATDQRQHGQARAEGHHRRGRPPRRPGADLARAAARGPRRLRHRHRGRHRERGGQAQDLHGALPGAEAEHDARLQHLVDLDHAARLGDRPAGALHRHSFHEPGAADAARRADPRHRDRGPDLRGRQGPDRPARQDRDRRGGFPGLHRQPHPAADDQRGDLHALRGRRHRSTPSTPP